MIKKLLRKKWMWFIYIILFAALIGHRIYAFFWPGHPAYFYHQTFMIFSVTQNLWPLTYLFAIASLLLNSVMIILLLFYAADKKPFSIPFIVFITIARLMTDLKGYSYEWNTIRALFFESASTSHLAALNLILWIIPSYLAMGDYIIQKIKRRKSLIMPDEKMKNS